MALDTQKVSPGVRRFLEYARSRGYEPQAVGMKPSDGATTLVYATGTPPCAYFLVFQRRYPKEKILRKSVREIIGKCDVVKSRKEGEISVRHEMEPGYMTPFVSEEFSHFSVWLDSKSFEGDNLLAFPAGANGNEFAMPACIVKGLLIGLYGREKVFCADLLS